MSLRDEIIKSGQAKVHFEPYDIENWTYPGKLYMGRPGEEEFTIPGEVQGALDAIRQSKPHPFYTPRNDGRFDIYIAEYNLRGIATFR